MDPYLENSAAWPDFQTTYLVALRAELNADLPRGYVARIDRHVWIDDPDAEHLRLLGRPDVYVADELNRPEGTGAAAMLASPATATLPVVDPKGKAFLKVIDIDTKRVVTVVELLSPANKSSGKDGEAYRSKRAEYFRTGINVVELDLLREGRRPPLESPLPAAHYFVLVSRAADFPPAAVWPFNVRDPMPVIPVPLDPGVNLVPLALRPALDRAFDEAKFDEELPYGEPLDPPLGETDAAWARQLVTAWLSSRR